MYKTFSAVPAVTTTRTTTTIRRRIQQLWQYEMAAAAVDGWRGEGSARVLSGWVAWIVGFFEGVVAKGRGCAEPFPLDVCLCIGWR